MDILKNSDNENRLSTPTGTGDGQFRHQHCMDVDSCNNPYVTVRDNFEVQKFSWEGTFIGKWESTTTREGEYRDGDPVLKEGVPHTIFQSDVTRDGELLEPLGIDVDSFGNEYVVNVVTLNVQKFTTKLYQ